MARTCRDVYHTESILVPQLTFGALKNVLSSRQYYDGRTDALACCRKKNRADVCFGDRILLQRKHYICSVVYAKRVLPSTPRDAIQQSAPQRTLPAVHLPSCRFVILENWDYQRAALLLATLDQLGPSIVLQILHTVCILRHQPLDHTQRSFNPLYPRREFKSGYLTATTNKHPVCTHALLYCRSDSVCDGIR